jgi:hypothetical protein
MVPIFIRAAVFEIAARLVANRAENQNEKKHD